MAIGQGTTIAWEGVFTAKIRTFAMSGLERESNDVTLLSDTGFKKFDPSTNVDGGEVTMELEFDSGVAPPWTQAAEPLTIQFANGDTWAVEGGFLTGWTLGTVGNETTTAEATVKLSGAITVTEA